LLVGSGYNHPKLDGDEDYQLGFFFDHTTGMPLIPSSSIKGVIRSLFTEEKFGYILELIQDIGQDKQSMKTIDRIEKILTGESE